MTESAPSSDTAKPMPMSWAAFEARARAEGIWDAVLEVGIAASMAGAEAALQDIPLPEWAQEVVGAQFPAWTE